jgi:hypothetical protein
MQVMKEVWKGSGGKPESVARVQADALKYITDATRSPTTGTIDAGAFAKRVKDLDDHGRLHAIFGKKNAQTIRDYKDIAVMIQGVEDVGSTKAALGSTRIGPTALPTPQLSGMGNILSGLTSTLNFVFKNKLGSNIARDRAAKAIIRLQKEEAKNATQSLTPSPKLERLAGPQP